MTHTKDLRARVVANTILFLFILQKLKVQVVSHDPTIYITTAFGVRTD